MNTADCLFCKIATGALPSKMIYEDDYAIVIQDIAPAAPVHLLAIPRTHYSALHEVPADELAAIMGALSVATKYALAATGLDNNGYRLVINSGDSGGQTVPHLHIHILGGREMTWPPG